MSTPKPTGPTLATLCQLYSAAVASGDERAQANVIQCAARWGFPTSLLTAAARNT
jgi:hypothetical protein